MNVDIEITEEEMGSKRFKDFCGALDKADDMLIVYIIRCMTKYTDSDKKYMWVMSGNVATRILNVMWFPEVMDVDGELSYLLGYPVVFETFLPVKKKKDNVEECGEVIAYPYIWLKEYNPDVDGEMPPIKKESFIEESYVRANKALTNIDFMLRNMTEAYKKTFDPTEEELGEYNGKLRAHLRQLL